MFWITSVDHWVEQTNKQTNKQTNCCREFLFVGWWVVGTIHGPRTHGVSGRGLSRLGWGLSMGCYGICLKAILRRFESPVVYTPRNSAWNRSENRQCKRAIKVSFSDSPVFGLSDDVTSDITGDVIELSYMKNVLPRQGGCVRLVPDCPSGLTSASLFWSLLPRQCLDC